MDKGRFLIETHLRTGKPLGELARAHGVNRSWLYKLLARYRRDGPEGLEPRSRRPRRSPSRIADLYEDEIVALRKELLDFGVDAGAETIHFHMAARHRNVPSVSTIWRVLQARGFVTPQPHKRPRSSYQRFEAEFPNECWQADMAHVAAADGSFLEVLNIVDDHSRLCIASRAFVTVRATDVIRTVHRSAEKWGYPASFLTDNGAIFTGQRLLGMAGATEMELLSLGIEAKHARPYHPQTCGKVERFHQTLKKFLAKQDPVSNRKQLQVQLDRFVEYYNDVRPHRALRRHTPAEVYAAREKDHPRNALIDCRGYRVLNGKVDKKGAVSIRHNGRLHHIGIGAAYKGWRLVMLVAGLDIRILALDGSPLRHLKLDPTKDYQPMG